MSLVTVQRSPETAAATTSNSSSIGVGSSGGNDVVGSGCGGGVSGGNGTTTTTMTTTTTTTTTNNSSSSSSSSSSTSSVSSSSLSYPVSNKLNTKLRVTGGNNNRISNELHQKISKLTTRLNTAETSTQPPQTSTNSLTSTQIGPPPKTSKRSLPFGEFKQQRASFNLDERSHSYLKFNDLKVGF